MRLFGIIPVEVKQGMSIKKRIVLLVAVLAGTAFAEKQPYSRYQTIVDRQMFGPLPVGFDPAKMPSEVTRSAQKELTKEQEQLKSAIRFSVINMTPDGQVAVGFTDNSDGKNPRHYYLKVGETRGGWLVKEADPETATMTIAKGDIEVTLVIGGDSAQDAGATAKAGAAPGAVDGGIMLLKETARRSPILGGGTLRSRRLAREAYDQKQAEERRKQQEEERQAREAEREAQKREFQEMREGLRAQLESLREDIKVKAKAAADEGGQEQTEHENNDAE